ncbi:MULTISPECIES: hypothetical protein [unclassified Thalassospira]|jgi:hypothetical protein|uniref:hypothetical protein n=1 Tax=unclassified Thalassospira TaxID=2648997 RepID=UPI001B107B32|nr:MULTISPECIES: hypothetical protein [unclassified Thalassospira]MBO6772352.1 hypothetical protein [Thalassospira sp.]MEE3044902.1 hypothetical protein [Pseudomonadota bacterium]URK18405.1 hypothetical protein M9H61_02540 [Thalassospira sp. GO-4]|tara:strand:+ start:1005 stop:1532 length:528 start_codon:yes stop_codon:yes gene_type:complete
MTKHNHPTPLPVLDAEMGERIRQVVNLFDRKKDAAEIAGVIPEQLNRWCQAQSEPRFVGVSRMALIKGINLNWIATGKGKTDLSDDIHPTGSSVAPDTIHRDMLMAMISGFLAAEGIDNGAQIALDILKAHDEIVEKIEKNRHPIDSGYILAEAISTIIARHRSRDSATNSDSCP